MDTGPAFETLALRQEGAVLHLTLNRPAQRNAMSLLMVQELRRALLQAEADAVRVIVLRGAGGHFCAGADLKDMAAARTEQTLTATSTAFGDLCVAFANTGLAVIAVLEGTVMGGGFGVACVADVALAGRSVSFRLPETTLGLVPAQIAPFLVERIGAAEARRLAVTGARLDADEALALRLVHAVHDDTALDAALAQVLRDTLQAAPGAIAQTKALITRARCTPAAALVQDAAAVFAQAALGAEGVEGTAAFIGRRAPAWAPR